MNTTSRNRILSLNEANKMLPLVKRITADIRIVWMDILTKRDQLQQIEEHLTRCSEDMLAKLRERSEEIKMDLDSLITRINGYIYEIEELGCIAEEFRRGVINFPSLYLGRKILLCWTPADGDKIIYWHELDESYNERNVIRDKRDFLVRRPLDNS